MDEAIEIFFSYAHEDEKLCQGLEKQLKALQRQGLIKVWHHRDIGAGQVTDQIIDEHLNTAQIILLLISPDFVNSDYCYSIEMAQAMKRHERGEAHVIPVLLRPVYWENAPFGKLQALPLDGLPVVQWRRREDAFYAIAEGIRQAIHHVQTNTSPIKKKQEHTTIEQSQIAYQAGLQHLRRKSYAEALQQFHLALAYPSFEILFHLGEAYQFYAQSFKEQDASSYTNMMKRAAEYFEQAISSRPDAPDAYIHCGDCYEALILYAEAVTKYQQAKVLIPHDSSLYYKLGLIALQQHYYREAEDSFLKGLKQDPHHEQILYALGTYYRERNLLPSARSIFRQMTQWHPTSWKGWYELGRLSMKEQAWEQALQALMQALQCEPDISVMYSALAVCYHHLHKETEANEMIEKALQYDPKNTEALHLQQRR